MFERFTHRARHVLVRAQEEAKLLTHDFIGTEDILLGLVADGDSVAGKALASSGVTLDSAREKVKQTVGPAAGPSIGSPPFTPRVKRVLELSLREALMLGHEHIGTEHVLLGLIREGEGVGAQVLIELGVDLHQLRTEVFVVVRAGVSDPEGWPGLRRSRLPERHDEPSQSDG
jgi:ATP-dependent Clp protease ATP-binding subunit ClpC